MSNNGGNNTWVDTKLNGLNPSAVFAITADSNGHVFAGLSDGSVWAFQ